MIADVGMVDAVYVAVMLGSMVLLAILSRVLPWLLSEEVARVDIVSVTPARRAREPNAQVGPVLPRP